MHIFSHISESNDLFCMLLVIYFHDSKLSYYFKFIFQTIDILIFVVRGARKITLIDIINSIYFNCFHKTIIPLETAYESTTIQIAIVNCKFRLCLSIQKDIACNQSKTYISMHMMTNDLFSL